MGDYWGFIAQGYNYRPLRDFAAYANRLDYAPALWSARLSSGLFGFPSCEAGRRGPKGSSEVIMATGVNGLKKLIELGFVNCPVCKPEETPEFWKAATPSIRATYEMDDVTDFLDREKLPFDSRRVKWEELVPRLKAMPNRLYVPRDLPKNELITFKKRIEKLGVALPPIGFYDRDAPDRFSQYKL